MLCDICGNQEATIFYKEMVNNKYTEMNLCEKCAHDQELKKINFPMAITNLLSALTELGTEALPKEKVEVKCPGCGSTYSDFCEKGRLGCGQCYQSFSEPLSTILRKIHGSVRHIGKSPGKVLVSKEPGKIDELEKLRLSLAEAIKAEEYEEAAKLRDKIRELEKE